MGKGENATIAELIRAIVKPLIKIQAFTGKVTKVDRENETCDVQPDNGDAEVFDVRLTAVQSSKETKFLLVPKVGSDVVCCILENNPNVCFIAQYSELEKIEIDVAELVFNGGENGGIIVVKALIEKLNRLEQRIMTHQHLVGQTPTAVDPATNSPFVPTMASEIINDKIKH